MMKLRHIYIYLLLLGGLLLGGATACSSGGVRHSDSAVIDTDSYTSPAEAEDEAEAVLTDRGIEPIRCNMRVSDIRPNVELLYDSILIDRSYAYTLYKFLYEGEERFRGYDFGNGSIAMIEATSPDIVVETPDGKISLDMPFTNVLRLPGVTAQYQNFDDGGIWSWVWQGLYFLPAQQNLSQGLSSKLYSNGAPPTLDDFDDHITIDYIGTGFPY